MPQKHLDTLNRAYDDLKAAGLEDNQILNLLETEASLLENPHLTQDEINKYLEAKGLKKPRA